jgi:hypothetical protein
MVCGILCEKVAPGLGQRRPEFRKVTSLCAEGFAADHIIALGWRGATDGAIRERLQGKNTLFMTQDVEFLSAQSSGIAVVIVSRVRQSRPIAERVAIWQGAVRELMVASRAERLYELSDDGTLTPVTHAS